VDLPDGRLDDMRKALSVYYSETEIDPQLVDTLTNAEGDNLVASLSIDNLQKEAHRRESSQDRKITALT